VRKARRCEDADVRAIMDAGTESVEWVRQEFARADLRDKRLDRRLVRTAEQLAKSPASPINEACGTWASTQAAYRLFNNPKVSPAGILKPHWEATAERMAGCGGAVLMMQDTVFFSYGKHVKTRGLGPIGKSNATHERGLVMHNALAFTSTGVPLGIVSQSIWARGEIPEEDYQEKIERLQVTAIEEKESSKWLIALKETVARAPAGVPVVTVADRESDFFEFLTHAKELRANFLIRARTDRKLVPEASEGCVRMLDALSDAPALGRMRIEVPGNGSRKARTANIEVRVAQITIQAPPRRGAQAKASGSSDPVALTLIGATEQSPPAGSESISWVLLTNLIVKDLKSATEKVQWYAKRWGIEIWHKVLKSGCKVEECMLEEAERLKRYLTLFSIIGVRLMHVAYLARAQPDLPATEVFSVMEIQVLHLRVTKALPAEQSLTLREVVRMLGKLGGHLGRKCDGEPGVLILWRGWMRLYESVEMLHAMQSAGLLETS
jgi:hypothetical protein